LGWENKLQIQNLLKKKLSGKEIILNNISHLGKVNRLPSLVNSWSKVVNGWSLGEEREVTSGRFS
jgi:hypothetical protein